MSLAKLNVALPAPCHHHDVLQLQTVFEFRKILGRNAAGLSTFGWIGYAPLQRRKDEKR
jgi:hypothetical protein